MGKEQRQHPRLKVPMKVEVRANTCSPVLLRTVDISDGGVMLDYPEEWRIEIGMHLTLQLQGLPVENGSAPLLHAEVVHCCPEGFGVRFLNEE